MPKDKTGLFLISVNYFILEVSYMKRAIITTLLSLGMIFLSCCECWPPTTTITYKVDGILSDIGVEFHNEFGDLERFSSIRVPWVKTFNVQHRDEEHHGGKYPGGIYPAYVSAIANERFGTVNVEIYVNGELVAKGESKAPEFTAMAWYAVRL
jgi:hypothetical protein